MNILPFEKYEGAGNDFIIVDFFEHGEFIDLEDQQFIEKLCDRRFGIGADGLMALCRNEPYDFEMKYLNSDGRFSTFCGNGSRCISLYASRKWNKQQFKFVAADGEHESIILQNNQVKVRMKDINLWSQTECGILIDSGSPHLIHYVDNAFKHNVKSEGRKIRNEYSKEGANVNFVQLIDTNKIRIATYERGVEDETLACGTGITAAAYFHAIKNKLTGIQSIDVDSKGGNLQVELRIEENSSCAHEIYLTGPARHVYSGFYEY